MENIHSSNKKTGIIVGAVIVLIIAFVAVFSGRSSTTDTVLGMPPAATSTVPAGTDMQTASAYKDGTYTAIGSYMSPGGLDKISVTLTLAKGIITAASVDRVKWDTTSGLYQDKFISGYKQYVIGKNVADLKLTKVSGSSLTPAGFNDALAQIKAQAKS